MTSTERREVAERLRELDAKRNEQHPLSWHGTHAPRSTLADLADAVGIDGGDEVLHAFARLADLIDPPGAEGASACGVDLARLMLAHPDLPVLKLHTEADEDDNYVLKLTGARLGTWWLADARVWDDYEDACYALGDDWTTDDEDMAIAPDDIPHGRCIWVDMDYA